MARTVCQHTLQRHDYIDSRRRVLWAALYRHYFARYIRPEFTVLELGAGYGYFINNVNATRRIAVDLWAGMTEFLDQGVEAHIRPIQDLGFLEDRSVDFTFASNVFEHMRSPEALLKVLRAVRIVLRPGGRLVVMQPNVRLLGGA